MAYVVERTLFDFSRRGALEGWRPIDDVVMGGCSCSRIGYGDAAMVFSGTLSLAQGGGFASIRSPEGHHDLSDGTALVLTARGDGRRYKLGLRLQPGLDAPVYQAAFAAPEGGYREILVPFGDLRLHYHGRALDDAPPFNPRRVCSLGVLIADRQAGPFRLEIRAIAVR